jgi:hypothetical protein
VVLVDSSGSGEATWKMLMNTVMDCCFLTYGNTGVAEKLAACKIGLRYLVRESE